MISISEMTKRFGRTTALDGMSLEVEKGAVFGLIGPNGAGKTTVMSILATLQLPDGGRATISGRDVTSDIEEVRGLVGYMPDFFGVYDGLKVYEYLDFFASAYHLPEKGRDRLIGGLLELVNLGDKEDFYVDLLSRGMKQRLALARCLVHDPEVLILDEPASGLDPRARAEMKEIIRHLGKMGKTVLISSHILPELGEICDQVAIMENGRVVVSGPVEEVTAAGGGSRVIVVEVAGRAGELALMLEERPHTGLVEADGRQVKFFYRGSREDQGALLKEIIDGGHIVIQYHEVRRNLEEAFMAVTGEVNGK
ncbi:MAG: ABC transporter [Peptococcaceae bacterium BICA1-7]|nr:MAG: ABC transporter [Peptococcaceae bacterium BICA1-7]HBV99063.1 ABC transporter ATP-binding protein [Desulfotomaculum sp.]